MTARKDWHLTTVYIEESAITRWQMKELQKKDCFIVRKQDEAAKELMIKLCKQAKPGAVIFVSDDEFNCLKDSVIRLEVTV